VWRMTTIVGNGPDAMIGKHGHYELEFDDDGMGIAVRRVGMDFAALPSARVMTGHAKLSRPFAVPDEPGEQQLTFRVDLRNARGAQPLVVEAWFSGDRMIGRWYYEQPGERGPDGFSEFEGEIVGALRGERGGTGMVALASPHELPCPICCDATYNCGPDGVGGCNGSWMCHGDCKPFSEPHGAQSYHAPAGRRVMDLAPGCAGW